jgi:hypothetical protein
MSATVCLRDLIELSKDDVEDAMKQHAADTGGTSLAGFAASVGADVLNKELDNDFADALAVGWTKVQTVREAARRSLEHPGEDTLVTLGQHDLTSTHYPVLTISVARLPVTELKFTLELVARFKSVGLAIRDGRLRAVAPGEASAIARIKYKDVKLKEKQTPAWRLPGEIRLAGEGVLVAR